MTTDVDRIENPRTLKRDDISAGERALSAKLRGRLSVAAFSGAVAGALAVAWLYRASGVLTPEQGAGYWLGIAGALMMLAVLLYPLRKRARFMRSWFRLPLWFRWHMVFGILGPTLIVIHANFGTQSLNAFVALVSMLTVVGSGIIGRYLYVRVHRGLYGAKLEVRELLAEAVSMRGIIEKRQIGSQEESDLKELERFVTEPKHSLLRATGNLFRVSHRIRKLRRKTGSRNNSQLLRYFEALERAGSFVVYDRLFSLWHVLHLPLIILLVVTAIIHVVAVHLY